MSRNKGGKGTAWRRCRALLLLLALALAAPAQEAAVGLLDLPAVQAAATEVTREAYPDADDVLVDDHIVVIYETDGTSVTHDDTVVKILTEKGRNDNRVLTRHFNQSYGTAEFLLVQV
ncbi:MAG: hypothetical protein PHC30_04115, partial [Lentisphaeria bacterium]|nr:hypothetical protein [Lentisphaeria bacterium]